MNPLGDGELEALYTRLARPLYNVVRARVWETEEAHDIVQEAFVRLWRMRRRTDRETAKALVFRIALNLATSRLRWRRIRRLLPVEALASTPAAGPSPEQDMADGERTARLRAAILDLPEEQRDVVLLCEYTELGYEQIATVLGISPGTVASRRHRALERLRRHLGGEERGGARERAADAGAL
jgi:RNA polymerase sigma-70 factor (ECF subfamily)